jgi:Concanavalin A-like lectin/glucanases superfamily
MATITGLTADRMIAIENASVVDGDVVGDDLILTTKGGQQINAGNVRGPEGDQGPVGSDLAVITSKQILDVGLSGQIRAGRQLTATDFTNMGLSAPRGLWNLSNLNDSSGNGRNLTNKGAVPFATGIEGVASSAAQFAGSASQALYILDTGAADPFRIRTGSVGCWFKTARGGVAQAVVGKYSITDGQQSFWVLIDTNNKLTFNISPTGLDSGIAYITSMSNVCDDRWHFGVAVCDGSTLYVYVDGILENSAMISGIMFPGSAPLNIGSLRADASTASYYPHLGRIDEVFITGDILSEDQIRNLYCVKIPHTLSAVPKNVGLNVRRRKKGAALASGDFPTPPLRLYNFSAGSLNDEGSNGQVLTNNGSAVSVAGVDGSPGNAFNFSGASQQLTSTDTGLPSALASKSYGFWVKHPGPQNSPAVMSWGSGAGTTAHAIYINPNGIVVSRAYTDDMVGGFVSDGQWHFVVVTEENAPLDGGKRKFYVDGRYMGGSVNMVSIGLGGANRFRLGQWPDGTGTGTFFIGQIDGVFICDYVLTVAQIAMLYVKGSQALGVSPKNPGDHVELMTNTDLFCTFDTLAPQHQIDLAVA